MGAPILVVNLKAYPTAVGAGALRIGRSLEREAERADVAVAIAPAAADLAWLAHRLSIPVLAQHADPADLGASTGAMVPASLRASGVRGSLVNHSEHPLPARTVDRTVAKLAGAGWTAIVCAGDVRAAARLARSHPPYLAIEPPELIGGDRAVSTARPEVVSQAVDRVHRVSSATRVLCGAGVHDRRDVAIAGRLGSEGILVASAVTTAPEPARAIRELLRGFGR